MHRQDIPPQLAEAAEAAEGADALGPLLRAPMSQATHATHTTHLTQFAHGPHAEPGRALPAVVVGELLALVDGAHPLVRFAAGGDAAVPARSTVDLHGAHIGAPVLLVFEDGDAARPIVTGVLREGAAGWPLAEPPAQVQVDADGQRMLVHAREQLVLRCGKASITLTKAGKVLIEGSYVLSRSTGVNRVKGGSVQLN